MHRLTLPTLKEHKQFGTAFTRTPRFVTGLEGSEIMGFKAKVKAVVLLGK